jgi:5'-phosphate synthase pdxT subunit
MPGGESTVMVLGVEREGLAEPLRAFATEKPVLATCAGLIMLDRDHLGALDLKAERNAFGRQTRSFEADLAFPDEFDGDPVHAIFIRAPWVSDFGPGVEVLASVDGHPVAVRQGAITALSFHPELSGESRFHARLLERAAQ